MVDDVLTVASFILWHEPYDMCGGRKRDETFTAFCNLMNIDEQSLRDVVRPQCDEHG